MERSHDILDRSQINFRQRGYTAKWVLLRLRTPKREAPVARCEGTKQRHSAPTRQGSARLG
jgi:hypothetical protein